MLAASLSALILAACQPQIDAPRASAAESAPIAATRPLLTPVAYTSTAPPPVRKLPNDPRLHVTVRAHDLRDYEQLTTEPTDEHESAERTAEP